MSTNLDLDTIRARADAATVGPWDLITDACDCGDGYGCSHGEFPFALRLPTHTVYYADKPCDPNESLDSYHHQASDVGELTMETAEFIAHAREDIPALLAEIDRLRAELATLAAAEVTRHPSGCGCTSCGDIRRSVADSNADTEVGTR